MSTFIESLKTSPAALKEAGFYFDNPPAPKAKSKIIGCKGDPLITAAAMEYAAIHKQGKPPAGTLKAIAIKYGLPASSIATKVMRMSLP